MVCHSVGSARRPGHIPTPSHSWTSTCWRRWQTFLLDDEEHLRKWRGHYLGTEDRNIVEQLGLTEDTENATDALRPRDHIAATASQRATNAARPRPAENGADRNVRQRIEIAPTAAVGATNAPLPLVRQPVGIPTPSAASAISIDDATDDGIFFERLLPLPSQHTAAQTAQPPIARPQHAGAHPTPAQVVPTAPQNVAAAIPPVDRVTHWATGRRQGGNREATGRRQASDRQATGKRQESDRLPRWATGRRQGDDREATGRRQEDDRQATGKRQASDRRATGYHVGRQGGDREATGRRQGGGRKTTGKRQEGDREATGNSDRRATGGNDRRATGERQEGARQKVAWRQETTGSDRKRQDSDRRAARKRQGSDRRATGERQDSDREATGKRQGSDRGLKVPKQRQGGDREATGWRQEGEVARI